MKKLIYDAVGKVFLNMNIAMISESEVGRYTILTTAQANRYNSNHNLNRNIDYVLNNTIPTPTLEELKEAALTTLKTNMYLLIKDGHTYNGFVFNYDEDTTMNIIKQKNRYELKGGDLFKITDRTKTQRHFTKIELYEFGANFSSYIAPLEEQYANAKNNIGKATNETELEAVDLELRVEE